MNEEKIIKQFNELSEAAKPKLQILFPSYIKNINQKI